MVASLQEFDAVMKHFVYQPVGLIDSSGPDIAAEMLQVLRLADASCWISKGCLHQVKDAECGLPVGIHPVAEVLQALILDDRAARTLGTRAQGRTPRSRRSMAKSAGLVRPRRARVRAASRRTAFSGERKR